MKRRAVRRRRRALRALLGLPLISVVALGSAAAAQTGGSELPTGPADDGFQFPELPAEDNTAVPAENAPATDSAPATESAPTAEAESTSESGGGLGILEGVVEIDEDGTVRWKTEAEPVTDAVPEAPLSDQPDTSPSNVESSTNADVPTVGGNDNSGGRNPLPLILGAVVIVGAAGVFVLSRRGSAETLGAPSADGTPSGDDGFAPQLETPIAAGEYGGAGAFAISDDSSAGGFGSGLTAGLASHFNDESFVGRVHTKMVAAADKQLTSTGRSKGLGTKLELAGMQWRPAEWVVLVFSAAAVAGVFGFLVDGLLFALILPACAVGVSTLIINMKTSKRQRLFADQLPETLQLLAGSMRAGMSMIQGVSTVAAEAPSPTAEEFQRVIAENRLGRDLALSFKEMAHRMDSTDFTWVVTAIDIHREVGGDLAEMFDRVGATIRSRNRVRAQVKALSAEGKLSGVILFLLPPGMVGIMYFINRDYLVELTGNTAGRVILVFAFLLLLIGGAWLKRLVRFIY